MRIMITTILEINEDGSSTVIETKSQTLKDDGAEAGMPSAGGSAEEKGLRITARVNLTSSNLRYYYLALGMLSPIQLPPDSWISIKRGELVLQRRTHRTQLNRIDGMKLFLEGFSAGDAIHLTWQESTSTLEILDASADDGQ